jgi:hypothetical protein
MKISSINRLYSPDPKYVHFLHVPCRELSVYFEELSRFRNECNRLNDDDQLLDAYYWFRRCFFRICGSLLPYGEVLSQEIVKDLLQKLQLIKRSFPDFFKIAVVPLAQAFKTVIDMKENRMTEYICQHLNQQTSRTTNIAVVLKRTLVHAEEKHMTEILKGQNVKILNVSLFSESSFRKSLQTFDEVIFVGTPDYFEPLVVTSFKAEITTFISYEMFSNEMCMISSFSDLREHVISTVFDNIQVGTPLEKNVHMNAAEHGNEDVQSTVQKILRSQASTNELDTNQPVEAHIVYLENRRFIFASKESKIRIITSEGKGSIHHVSLKELEADDYIILRNERDSRLIAETADSEILKDEAPRLRELQERWKNQLRTVLKRKGMFKLCDELTKRHGMKTASPASVRNWCGEESICPQELPLLLKALGFEINESNEIVAAMKKIQSSHIQAGRLISEMLVREISGDIYQELLEHGSYTFTSSWFKGASFNIERVIGIGDTIHEVMPYNLMKPFKTYEWE